MDLGARLLRQLPPETAHNVTLALLAAAGPLLPAAAPDDPRLAVRAFGLDFPNPVGLAAGFDKDARVPDTGATFSGITIAFNTRDHDEVDDVLAQAVAADGTLLKPAEEVFWGGYSGYFADPDGHAWEVAWNPGWSIGETGHTSLDTSAHGSP